MKIQSRYRRRRATLVAAVLVCLTLVTVLFGVWLKLLSVERCQVRNRQGAMQAEYLAEAGLSRAMARLATDAAYAGEVWQPSADSLGTKLPAKVTISVAAAADDPRTRAISVAAEYPETGPQRAQRSRQQTIQLPIQEQKP